MRHLVVYLFLLFSFFACKEENKEQPQPQSKDPETTLPEGFPTINTEYTGISTTTINYLGKTYLDPQNPMTTAGVELGRYLFYDNRLSQNNSISCASCHKQEFAFTDTNQFSKGTVGQLGKRQSMSLVNLAFNDFFFWDGRAETIEHQVLIPIQDPLEMDMSLKETLKRLKEDKYYPSMFKVAFNDTISSLTLSKALSQFVLSIVSTNSKFDSVQRNLAKFSTEEQLGFDLFFYHPNPDVDPRRGADCFDCHGGRNFMSKASEIPFMNNGLDAEHSKDQGRFLVTQNPNDMGRFKLVTLRNIALTPPYMHDGRFKTLKEVLNHYSEKVKDSPTIDPHFDITSNNRRPRNDQLYLMEHEKTAIIAFLNTLTDYTLLTNPAFSDPFKK